MDICDEDKRTFTEPNELNNQEAIEGMLEGTGITELDLYQDSQAALNKK